MAAGDERRKNAVVLSRVRRVKAWLDAESALKVAVAPAWCAVTAAAAWRFIVQREVFAAGAVTAAVALAVWLVLARRKRVRLEEAAVIADRRAGAGGLLLTRLEVPVGEWELELNQRVRSITAPPVDMRRPASLLMLALIAGVIAFWVPLPPRVVTPHSSAAATRVDALEEKRAALLREEPDDAAANKELERLKEELEDGAFDSTDWEAADTLDAALDKKAAEAQAELSRADAAAKSLEDAMTGAQGNDAQTREREELENALMQLADGKAASPDEAMQQAMGQPQQGQNEKDPQGQNGQQQQGQQGSKSGPSKSQLSDLRQALQQRQQQLAKQFSPGSGQKSGSQSAQGPKGSQGKGEGKEKGEGKGDGDGDSNDPNGELTGNTGHGWAPPAKLRFGPEASMDPDRLKFEPLPDGQGGEGQELMGLRAANPTPGHNGKSTAGTSQAAAGLQARGNDEGSLLPRNRELIKRYFEK